MLPLAELHKRGELRCKIKFSCGVMGDVGCYFNGDFFPCEQGSQKKRLP